MKPVYPNLCIVATWYSLGGRQVIKKYLSSGKMARGRQVLLRQSLGQCHCQVC